MKCKSPKLLVFIFALLCNVTNATPNTLQLNDIFTKKYKLQDVEGNGVNVKQLNEKYVGVYFSASWCGACKKPTDTLLNFRNNNYNNFEVVFLSLDRDSKKPTTLRNLQKKQEYILNSKMNWLTINTKYMEARRLLNKTGKKTIPTLVVFSPSGRYINTLCGIKLTNNNLSSTILNTKKI